MVAHPLEPVADPGWVAALDRLELDLDLTEQLLTDPDATPPDSWTPPELGPLPAELLERATALHDRQGQVAADLAAAMNANTRQRSYAARVSDATARPTRPTYFDDRL